MSSKINLAKRITHVATGIGASKVATTIARKATENPNTTAVVKMVVLIGAVVASALVAEALQSSIDSEIDKIAAKIKRND